MQVKVYEGIDGILTPTKKTIIIKKNRWIDENNYSHPMKFLKPIAFEENYVYYLHLFGDDSKEPHKGNHISLSFWENQKFCWLQKIHWLQKEENIRYIINILFLLGGIILGVLNFKK